MGMAIDYFYNLSFSQWFNISQGYYNKIERQTRLQWETARMIMYATLLPHQKKGSELTVKSMLPFEWDSKTEAQLNVEVTTAEDIQEQKKRWEERDKKLKNKTSQQVT
jgi:hypothetical protein